MSPLIIETLKKQYYAPVPFSLEQSSIEDAVSAFLKFLEEPEDIKSHMVFSIAPKHRRGEVGFKKRVATDHLYNDDKEFFHYHPSMWEKYRDFIHSNPVVYDFLNKAKPIWEMTYQTMHEIFKTFDLSFPGSYDKIFNTDCVHIVLRFLKYEWQQSGKYLAKPHFDAGSFSLAIAESCPGLRIGSGPEVLKVVEYKPGNATFMFASNFRKVIDSDEFSAGWHDVIQLDEEKVGKPFARWAVVAFIEAHGVEALPRTETHKWYIPTNA